MPQKSQNWDLHRDEIEKLYMQRGFTLQKLQEAMSMKHDFTASTRAWKTKLEEWKLRKNKSRSILRKGYPRQRREQLKGSPASIPPSQEKSPSKDLSIPQLPTDVLYNWTADDPAAIPETSFQTSPSNPVYNTLWRNSIGDTVHQCSHYTSISTLGNSYLETPPLINSSLMLFSTRPPSVSLRLLANCPEQAPQALEILLRSWKPGGEHMWFAKRFLADSAYCRTIVGVNWTRWDHTDETLFDLVDQFVPEDEQDLLRKALLRADVKFEHPLGRLNAQWAPTWRLAIRETTWDRAKHQILKMEVRDRLLRCALSVVAGALVRSQETRLELLAMTGESELFEESRMDKAWILADCHEQGINIDI
ncbi:uncharacterized protein LY89DRAFT_740158 [Mollisia scopiformis]|uniref:Clr5 domain-containing protein n=1 Tax=Mollisia scopiformis TaxID=149040 RepID=A0A132BDG7_MOLSC|nr:uncharacterized protein LY89DRAFT_740158 [Mollisia scopiformis]KUJ10446.1 hypothetical protein LY89DRAFT_740158 [Mollisia scopiformis]